MDLFIKWAYSASHLAETTFVMEQLSTLWRMSALWADSPPKSTFETQSLIDRHPSFSLLSLLQPNLAIKSCAFLAAQSNIGLMWIVGDYKFLSAKCTLISCMANKSLCKFFIHRDSLVAKFIRIMMLSQKLSFNYVDPKRFEGTWCFTMWNLKGR